eukprot:scaffold57137_cov88-Phaeocystis_antarctica.AAC.1
MRLLKWFAAFCVLECVGAATLPSPSALRFDADVPDSSYNTAGLEMLRLVVREQAATIEAQAATILRVEQEACM